MVNGVKSFLTTTFSARDLGEAKFYLGINLSRDRHAKTIKMTHDRSVNILPDDILDDISHSFCPLHMEWFLPRFEVAV